MPYCLEADSLRSVACSLVFVSGCFSGFAAQVAERPDSDPRSHATPTALTLEGAIAIALRNNPELEASRGRVEVATGRADQARRWNNPELTLNAEDWPLEGGGGFSDAKQTVGLTQSIPFPGKKQLDGQIGRSGVRLSEAELNLRRVTLLRDVKSAFFQVLAAERLVEVADELVKVAESSAATARKRVAAGAAADQELLRAEIPLEQARTELAGFQREWLTARQSLALLLGRPDLDATPVSGSLVEEGDLALLQQGPETWLADHPSVQAVRNSRDRAELELRRARLEPYPDVRLGVAGGRIGETGESILELGLAVPLPILDRSKGRKQEAQAHLRIAEADERAIEQRLIHDWRIASFRFRAASEQVTSYRERILPKANEALRLVQAGFEQGKFGFLDLLDTQRTAAEARLAYQRRLLELNLARAELEALLPAPGLSSPSTP